MNEYHEIFDNLTERRFIDTVLDVICMVVSYDSKYLVAACQSTDTLFRVIGYSLSTYEEVFNHPFEGEFMKVNLIEQNIAGNVFVIAY